LLPEVNKDGYYMIVTVLILGCAMVDNNRCRIHIPS